MLKIKHKNYLIFFIVLILLILFVIFLIPKLEDIEKNKKTITEEKLKMDAFGKREQLIKQALEKETLFQEINNTLTTALVDKNNTLEYILPLENLAKEVDIKQSLEIIENVPEKKNEKNKEEDVLEKLSGVNVIVLLDGDYKKVLYYLNRLNSIGIFLNIESIKVTHKNYSEGSGTNSNEGENEGKVRANIELKIFSKN